MKTTDRQALIVFPILIVGGLLMAVAGSQGGSQVAGIPLFAVLVGLAFLIQWLAYIPAYLKQTEKFYDLTGSMTYLSVTLPALMLSPNLDARSWLLGALVMTWATRLGSFLFQRVHKAGKDDRFDAIKPSWIGFLNAWTIQALWVTFTASAALIAITSSARKELDIFALIGCLVWVIGFAIEVIADAQKSRFNADPQNKGKFIQSGLWSRSRHPNYFGEIALWVGVLIIALPVLQGWQWVALVSPVFVIVLLTRVSGIPMLEKKADQKWGGQADYEAYKKHTPVLFLRLK
jgi:steroid 5-alpha reductase family enzyme